MGEWANGRAFEVSRGHQSLRLSYRLNLGDRRNHKAYLATIVDSARPVRNRNIWLDARTVWYDTDTYANSQSSIPHIPHFHTSQTADTEAPVTEPSPRAQRPAVTPIV